MNAAKAFIRNHPVLTCFALTFAMSWGGALLAIGERGAMQGTTPTSDPRFVYALIAMLAGLSLTGILLTALVHGHAGLGLLLSRLLNWRVGARWYAVALLTAPLLMVTTLLALSPISPAFLPGILSSDHKASLVMVGHARRQGSNAPPEGTHEVLGILCHRRILRRLISLSRQGTEQSVQNPCSPTRISDGAVARHGHSIGSQFAHGLLETLAADNTRSELLHIEEGEGELRESVSLQIEIELPQIIMAPGGQDDPLRRLRPLQEQPQCFREGGSGIDVRLGDAGELATEAGEARKSVRSYERLKLGPFRFITIEQQQHGADFDRLFLPAEHPFLPTRRLDVDGNDATVAGDDRLYHIIHGR